MLDVQYDNENSARATMVIYHFLLKDATWCLFWFLLCAQGKTESIFKSGRPSGKGGGDTLKRSTTFSV